MTDKSPKWKVTSDKNIQKHILLLIAFIGFHITFKPVCISMNHDVSTKPPANFYLTLIKQIPPISPREAA